MMQKIVPRPPELPICGVRAALQKMINDSRQAASKEPCSERSLPPVAPPVSITSSLGYANWRARSILRKIASLESTSALAAYEGDLREVLIFQEVRLRTKVFNKFLQKECFLVQKAEVERNEKKKRSSLEKDWFVTVVLQMNFMQFLFDEEVCRYNLLEEQGHLRRSLRLHLRLSVISIEERKSARFLQAAEVLGRDELQQRRLMEVGQEIKYEILRRSLSKTFRKLHRDAIAFIKNHKTLLHAEERDRLAIEKMCFFSLDILMREETFNRTRVLRDDMIHIGERRKQNNVDEAQVLALRDQQSILLHESQIRQMVVESEECGWETVYSQFMLGWRDVYQRISVHNDVKTLISSLELFERRCIYDEYRKSLYEISNVYDYEHPIAQMHQKRYLQFFEDLLNGMSGIWVEESQEFASLKERYISFEVEVKAIHRTRVLVLEETVVRRQIEREELNKRKSRKLCNLREKCDLEAVNFARMIAMHESYEWDLLMYNVSQQCVIVPQEEIRREEFLKRLEVESEEQNSHVQLLFQQEKCQYHGAVSVIASRLLGVENTCRIQVFQNERYARFDLMRASFEDVEHQCRRTLARDEKRHRIRLLTRATAGEDLVARHHLFQRYIAAVSGSKLAFLQNCEETNRASIIKSEKSRRQFLISSIPYEHLYLRACEVDELAARLEIITEAELCIRSCAYTQGHDAHVAYCDSELRVLQAQLHFLSLSELYEDMERQLVHEIEPIMRKRIEEEQLTSLLFMKLAFEEGSCRQHLFYSEASGWDSVEKLAKRILGRQKAWEHRALLQPPTSLSISHREELLSYLQKHQELSYVAEVVQKKRRAIRTQIAIFMDELYWSRDAIFREEECARCGVMYFYKKEAGLSSLSSSFEGEKRGKREEKSSGIRKGCPEKTLHESPNLFIHSLVLYLPPEEVQQVTTLAISYTGESSLYRVPLRAAYRNPISANHREVLTPSVLHSWLPENIPFAGVIYFSLLDANEKAIFTASHLLKQEEEDSAFLSVDLDSYSGKLYLTKYMYSLSEVS